MQSKPNPSAKRGRHWWTTGKLAVKELDIQGVPGYPRPVGNTTDSKQRAESANVNNDRLSRRGNGCLGTFDSPK